MNIRNIAIIAHVDHGKTTLVDKLLLAGKLFKDHETPGELIMDSNDLERERGITILAKNASVTYKGTKINIIDTPGHADFGGEVERVLNMADGVLLLVDAFEGPMPQTRFVLSKALSLGLKPILVINKVDKENCHPEEVHESVFDLMFALDATQEQLNFPTVYGSAKQNWMSADWRKPTTDITYLLDTIIQYVPAPRIGQGSTQLQITSLDYSQYIGRIAIGRLYSGQLTAGAAVTLCKRDGSMQKTRIKELYVFEGLGKQKVEMVEPGEICAIVGVDGFEIGDTVADPDTPQALPPITIEEPTMGMLFLINDSPFFGREGKFVTSRHLKERLERELEKNLALRVMPTDSADAFMVYGRGVLHLSVLIETMRREGYELQVGQPQVIFKTIDGQKCEPYEDLTVDVPSEFSSTVVGMVTARRGDLYSMTQKGDRTHIEFVIPSRGTIGLRSAMLTATTGEAIMNHRFKAYGPYKDGVPQRLEGSLVCGETGEVIPYALDKLQDRGFFFVEPGDDVYTGQVIGENNKQGDLVVKVNKTKKLTNVRASGADEKMKIAPAVKFSLEQSLEYINKDEYVEVTPKSLRIRKIYLDENERKRASQSMAALSEV
ncbi:MAG: translational GTPase TypA [Chitinophagales bacterium]|jgi:GTP-binding protein|nr:translational GTPase TypA [Sphingobacteriales bacterium]MBP9141372.1 translational GTPase TypA [Chitinophagales bacterium]MDA0198088.1 translational GTPase TypA [Bacteroidota bacterium]MBK6890173.1 translational GTPase TypA [Sphingobacteriales bacterium]MBL0248765.1 translational GTPase TypA [Sphingobacteriales bacterium]